MDLSLDIKGVNSVEEALQKYVKPETLDQDNAYKCPKCKNKVRAQKRFTIQKAPNVLTLQLKRFDFNRHLSGKINRFIRYPEKINLRNYMSQRQGDPVLYHLYGVVVHSGHSPDHGHYYSYVKSPSKTWYCMNDSSVYQVNMNSVLNTDAYVLFYARINKNSSSNNSTSFGPNNIYAKNVTPVKGPYSSNMIANHSKQIKSPMVNGVHGKPSTELGTPIKREPVPGSSFSPSLSTNGPKIVPNGISPSVLPGSHNKISFPILTPQQKKQQQIQQQKEDGKRIVLQIKHGNSTTMEKSPDGKSKVVNSANGKNSSLAKSRLSGLVPYNDDSDSEQENISSASSSSKPLKSPNHRTSEASGTSSSSGSHMQASGDHHLHHNYASVRSIPLPSDSGDGQRGAVKTGFNKSTLDTIQNTSSPSSKVLPSSDKEHPSHSNQKHFQNGAHTLNFEEQHS
jgi:ubiquitin carboxyl-terminal hydrolase 36/42